MRAIVQDRYGSPTHLRLAEVDQPAPNESQVLVRVRAASVNATDWRRVRGNPFLLRLSAGIRRPKDPRLGVDAAGVVEAVGAAVTDLKPGDEVMGFRHGAFAEYVAGRMFVPKPSNLTFEEAATVPVAAGTALVALRDKGHLQPGQSVLVNGAGGGVGTFAVQIAKAMGAEVTATTRSANLELVRSLEADHVIDYSMEDVTRAAERWDLVVDIGGAPSQGKLLRLLAPGGTLVRVGAGKGFGGAAGGLVTALARRRILKQPIVSFIADLEHEHLHTLRQLIEEGRVRPVVDRTYPLERVPEAIAYVEREAASGKVVISV